MAWTQSDLDKIEKAIATGARKVRFQTHEVEYQSMGDMLKARDVIKASLAGDDSGGVMFVEYGGGH